MHNFVSLPSAAKAVLAVLALSGVAIGIFMLAGGR